VQSAVDTILVRVVVARPLTAEEQQRTIDNVRAALGYAFTVEIVCVEQIERGPTGKFEEFLSLVNT
jgi:hypothetical protein